MREGSGVIIFKILGDPLHCALYGVETFKFWSNQSAMFYGNQTARMKGGGGGGFNYTGFKNINVRRFVRGFAQGMLKFRFAR